MNKEEILERAVREWGMFQQLDMVVEECAELIQAINHYKRNDSFDNTTHMIEEGVDVKLMIEQLQHMTSNYQHIWNKVEQVKLSRLEEKFK